MSATPSETVPRVRHDSWTRLLYLQLGAFAFFLYAFSPSIDLLKDDLHLSAGVAGLHSTCYAAGVTLGSAAAPWYIRRVGGSRPALWWGLVGLSLSVGLFCSVPALPVTLPAAAICGVFGSLLCIAVPAALSRAHGPEFGPAAITEANAVAAFVGVAAPLAVGGAAAAGLGWRTALLSFAPLSALLYAALGRVREPELPAADEAVPAALVGEAVEAFGLGMIDTRGADGESDEASVGSGSGRRLVAAAAQAESGAGTGLTASAELSGAAVVPTPRIAADADGVAVTSAGCESALESQALVACASDGLPLETEARPAFTSAQFASESGPRPGSVSDQRALLGASWPTSAGDQPASARESRSISASGSVRDLPRLFWINQVAGVCAGAIEFCLTLWCATLLRDRAHLSAGVAATGVTAVVAGMAIGRTVGGRLALRVPIDALILGAFATNLVGFALFWATPNAVLMFGGLAVAGLGVSLQYPLLSARGIEMAGGQAELAGAINMFGGGIAVATAPFALGFLSDRVGIHTAYLLLPGFIVVAAAAVLASRRGAVSES